MQRRAGESTLAVAARCRGRRDLQVLAEDGLEGLVPVHHGTEHQRLAGGGAVGEAAPARPAPHPGAPPLRARAPAAPGRDEGREGARAQGRPWEHLLSGSMVWTRRSPCRTPGGPRGPCTGRANGARHHRPLPGQGHPPRTQGFLLHGAPHSKTPLGASLGRRSLKRPRTDCDRDTRAADPVPGLSPAAGRPR